MRTISGFLCVLAIAVLVGCGGGEENQGKDGDASNTADKGESKKSDAKGRGSGLGGTPFASKAGSIQLTGGESGNTKIEISGTKDGSKHSCAFDAISGEIVFDKDGPKTIDVNVETNSLTSDDDKIAELLKNSDFLDAGIFAKATLSSLKVAPADGQDATHTLTANLKVRSTTKSVTIPIKVLESTDGGFVLTGTASISRKEFGMTSDSDKVDDQVEIRAEVTGKLE